MEVLTSMTVIDSEIGCSNCPITVQCGNLSKARYQEIAHGCRGNPTCLKMHSLYNICLSILNKPELPDEHPVLKTIEDLIYQLLLEERDNFV